MKSLYSSQNTITCFLQLYIGSRDTKIEGKYKIVEQKNKIVEENYKILEAKKSFT